MWREIKILLIDDNEQRRHDLKVILDFLGEEVIVADSAQWKKVAEASVEESTEISAVILGDATQESAESIIEALLAWDKGLPILYAGSEAITESHNENVKRSVLATLTLPPSYNKL